MDNQKALEVLDENIAHAKLLPAWQRIQEEIEMMEVARRSIEKQISQKPRYTTIFEGEKAEKLKAKGLPNYPAYKCPKCNGHVASRSVATSIHPDGWIKEKYCKNCGQRLDWAEQEG